ncbi:AAA family ATPase [Blastococcus sp. Marseille-P5729]|uniref:AAA family ATPase n=1 Tax=Blastococcus sp. Marseille-P5729 TaxID=2086582 RepID=UPI000D100537|nr:AAA family ATPase [Blastococcus sp. Marseille-P5729]
MRLHSLTMTAIGPYVATETIDFDALAADGLFLFTGPTGAGKSTVLDAVTYALYGRLPGTRDGHLSRLKSDFADSRTKPEVVLEVTIGDQRLRVHRSPSYERPKHRGEGFTVERASVAVEQQVDGRWIGVEGARKENVANDWLQERIGLNCDQFTQVVLLPQGQFAEFLHASDDVREKLLTSLFNAHRFHDVEQWFDDRQRAEAARAAEAEAKVQNLLTTAQAVAEIPDDELPEKVDGTWFETLARTHRDRLAAAETAVSIATRLHEEAAARVRDAEDLVKRQQEYREAVTLRDRVEAQREGIGLLREKYDRAAAAAVVVPLERERADRDAELAQAHEGRTAAQERVAAIEPALVGKPLAKVRARARALSTQRGALDDALRAEQRIDAQRELVATAQEQAGEAGESVRALRQTLAELPAQRLAAEKELTELRERAAVREDAAAAVQRLTEALAASSAAEQTRARLVEARIYRSERADDATAAREAELNLRERRISGMAAELAGELRDGHECAVCGSISHPKPARRAGDAPTPEEIEAAEKRVDDARRVKEMADKSVGELESMLSGQLAVCGERPPAAIKKELKAARGRAKEASDAADRIPAALGRLEAVDADIERITGELHAAEQRSTELAGAVRELSTDIDRQSAAIEKARDGHASVAERAEQIEADIETIEAYAAAIETHAAADAALLKAAAAADEAAEEAGFVSVAEAVAASLSKQTLTEAAEMIAAFERDEVAAQTRLSDPRLCDLPTERPDLEGLQETLRQARADEHGARSDAASATRKADRLQQLARDSRADLAAALATAARAAEVKSLALLIRGMGPNTKKMNLTSYFLAARLEQVTAVASEHLMRMSSGRYTLRHTDERRTARGHGGLGLEVFDAYTGKARPPHSLSGGETFYASVALALGLAEVVTNETGAMSLDSLFIDEGFGSLDADTLDLAMRVIDDLRQVGRTIGVISHVEEMRTRITTQLVIERTDRGSRVLPH